MIEVYCPHCGEPIRDDRPTGSSRVHSVYKSREEAEPVYPPAFELIELPCPHCGKALFVLMLDERW